MGANCGWVVRSLSPSAVLVCGSTYNIGMMGRGRTSASSLGAPGGTTLRGAGGGPPSAAMGPMAGTGDLGGGCDLRTSSVGNRAGGAGGNRGDRGLGVFFLLRALVGLGLPLPSSGGENTSFRTKGIRWKQETMLCGESTVGCGLRIPKAWVSSASKSDQYWATALKEIPELVLNCNLPPQHSGHPCLKKRQEERRGREGGEAWVFRKWL